MIVAILLGMIGLYVAAYLAWQKYQAYQSTYANSGGGLNGLLAVLKA